MNHRRRGTLLVEMLTVILLVGTGGTLMAVAVGSILRSQRRVVEFGSRYAQVNDFLRCLSRDVRSSTTAVLQDGDGADLQQVLVIGDPKRHVSYRFYKQSVERTGDDQPAMSTKLWSPLAAGVRIIHGPLEGDETAFGVTVHWHRTDAKDPDPNRRLDMVTRCAGEMDL